jgi:hypothetical protein
MILRTLPLLLVLACTPTTSSRPPAPKSAGSVNQQPPSRSLVEWAADSASITCPYVGTSLTVAGDLRHEVAAQSPSAVVVRTGAASRGVLLVSAEEDGRPLRAQVLADFRWLHGALTGSVPDSVTVTALEINGGRIRTRYALGPDPGAPTYTFDYLLVHRNGMSCRLGAVAGATPGDTRELLSTFGALRDTPGIDVTDDGWGLLNGVLGFGLTLLR